MFHAEPPLRHNLRARVLLLGSSQSIAVDLAKVVQRKRLDEFDRLGDLKADEMLPCVPYEFTLRHVGSGLPLNVRFHDLTVEGIVGGHHHGLCYGSVAMSTASTSYGDTLIPAMLMMSLMRPVMNR